MVAEIQQSTHDNLVDIVKDRISSTKQDRSFYVADMEDIYAKHQKWFNLLPRVHPYYAVKCNNLPEVLGYLASLGTSFDCASKKEIEQVLALGVSPDRIIYANPCKTNSYIRHAKNVKVDLMTFDNELELYKVAQLHPDARLVLRIKGDEASSKCKFNLKFGADLDKCQHLLKKAKELNLNVMGVSFHNGSNCLDPNSYEKSIASCKRVHDMAAQLGHKMTMVDLGGGFPGDSSFKVTFDEIAKAINLALDKYFPDDGVDNIDIIAEPGRYYVSSAMTLCTMVIAKREEYDEKTDRNGFMYYLNDGIYSAFNNVLYDYYVPEPELIPVDQHQNIMNEMDYQQQVHSSDLYSSVMWGPTCDSLDCVKRDFLFPELNVGQWIMFKNMGAYTCVTATNFNGFDQAIVIVAANNLEPINNSIDSKRVNIKKTNGKFNGVPAVEAED